MLEGKTVAVVVPAHNEDGLIAATLQGIPGFVDRIFVIDDASTDATAERARSVDDPRVEVIVHERNSGVGRGDRDGLQARADHADGCDRGDGRRQPDGSRRARGAHAADRSRRARLLEGEPALHRQRLEADPAQPVHRERDPQPVDEGLIGLLAHRRLAGRLHGALASPHAAARPRPRSTPPTASRTTCSCTSTSGTRECATFPRGRSTASASARASASAASCRASRGSSGRASSGACARST